MVRSEKLENPMQSKFRKLLSELMMNRLTSIPWHHTNSGIEVQRQHVWKLETLFQLLQFDPDKSYLVAYDTLGFFTYLLRQIAEDVTYHSTVDKYEFSLAPKKKWIVDIRHLPPKSETLKVKYDRIVVPSLFHEVEPAHIKTLLVYFRSMLNTRGSIVCSFTMPNTPAPGEQWYHIEPLAELGLLSAENLIAPDALTTGQPEHFVVARLEVL